MSSSSTEVVDDVEVKSYELNKSAWFLLPLLELNINRNKNFINTYLLSKERDYNFNTLYVELYSREDRLERNKLFIDKFESKNGIVYIFRIPEYYDREYNLFLEGKYSQYSEKSKLIICKNFSNNTPITSTPVYGIFYKTEERRKHIEDLIGEKLPADAELCSIVNLDKEFIYE